MKSEDKLSDLLESIKNRASADCSCMHEMSKDEFISEYISRIIDVAYTYYKEQCEEARERYRRSK